MFEGHSADTCTEKFRLMSSVILGVLRGHWEFVRGVLVVLTLWMSQIYIKEAKHQFSYLYHT